MLIPKADRKKIHEYLFRGSQILSDSYPREFQLIPI